MEFWTAEEVVRRLNRWFELAEKVKAIYASGRIPSGELIDKTHAAWLEYREASKLGTILPPSE